LYTENAAGSVRLLVLRARARFTHTLIRFTDHEYIRHILPLTVLPSVLGRSKQFAWDDEAMLSELQDTLIVARAPTERDWVSYRYYDLQEQAMQ
jgi:hypothetical protein